MLLDTLTAQFAGQFRHSPHMQNVMMALAPLITSTAPRLILRSVPDDSNISVAANGTYEGRVTVPASTRLYALSGSSAQAAGFDLQLRPVGTTTPYFGRRTRYEQATGQATAAGTPQNKQWFFPRPLLLPAPAELLVQIWNRAAVANSIQLVLWFAAPGETL
jgi:hypothetical protein